VERGWIGEGTIVVHDDELAVRCRPLTWNDRLEAGRRIESLGPVSRPCEQT